MDDIVVLCSTFLRGDYLYLLDAPADELLYVHRPHGSSSHTSSNADDDDDDDDDGHSAARAESSVHIIRPFVQAGDGVGGGRNTPIYLMVRMD